MNISEGRVQKTEVTFRGESFNVTSGCPSKNPEVLRWFSFPNFVTVHCQNLNFTNIIGPKSTSIDVLVSFTMFHLLTMSRRGKLFTSVCSLYILYLYTCKFYISFLNLPLLLVIRSSKKRSTFELTKAA